MTAEKERLSRRIAKLLRIAKRDGGNQGRTAQKIADELMSTHKIRVVLPASDEPAYQTRKQRVVPSEAAWLCSLSATLAFQHGCTAYFDRTPGTFGILVLTGLSDRLDALQAASVRYRKQFDALGGRRAGPSFRFGCAVAVYEMYEEQRQKTLERRRRAAKEETEQQDRDMVLRHEYIHAESETQETDARAHGSGGAPGDAASADTSAAESSSEKIKSDAESGKTDNWHEPPIDQTLYKAGYTAMRQALGMGVPILRHFGWRFA